VEKSNKETCVVRAGKKLRPGGAKTTVMPDKVKSAEMGPDMKPKTENN